MKALLPGPDIPDVMASAAGSRNRRMRAGRSRDTLRVLVELRPCFEGYAGIPQQTRALFAALAAAPGIRLGGLVNQRPLDAVPDEVGLPRPQAWFRAEALLGRWFGRTGRRLVWLGWALSRIGQTQHLAGKGQRHLDPGRAGPWLWSRLFAKGLPPGQRGLLDRARYPLAKLTWSDSALLHLFGRRARVQLDLDRQCEDGWDLLVAQTPWPTRVAGAPLVISYFDAIPLFWPHTISSAPGHAHSHYSMLARNVAEGAWLICNSEAVRRDLLRAFPQAAARSLVVPVLTPGATVDAPALPDRAQLARIIARGRVASAPLRGDPPPAADGMRPLDLVPAGPYFLAVSTLEPRKNFGLLMRAAARACRLGMRARLVMVARPGWASDEEVLLLRALVAEGVIDHLADVPGADLAALYRGAHAVICPSRSEGFDLATTEAMAAGVPVLASDIEVHREICADAALYFDPYDMHALADHLLAFGRLDPQDPQLGDMRAASRRRAARFAADRVGAEWIDALRRIAATTA